MNTYAYKNAVLLDGTKEMQPVHGMMILVANGKIEKIVPDTEPCDGYTVIDLHGQYLMPGLINLHVHLAGTGKPKKKAQDPKKAVRLVTCNALMRRIARGMVTGYARTQLMSGVTTVRTVGGIKDFDASVRDRILADQITGPRILASNMAVSVPGGHMAGSLAYEANTPEEAADYVREIAKTKPDLIKLMITGGVLDATVKGEPGVLKMKPELVRAACDAAHALSLPVAAHVESPEGVRVALENGVDTIEHGAMPDETILKLFHETGASLVTTLSPALPFALFDRSVSHATELSQFNGKVVMDGIIACAKACLAEQIPVGLGTDTGCPFITQYDMWRELYYFQKYCGVTPAFALYTATLGNAEIAGIDKETGSLTAGKCADFVVTKDNPLENLQALRNISMVVTRGICIDHPQVKKIAAVEKELDKYL